MAYPAAGQVSRARRFTLRERLESDLLAVVEDCIDAAYSKHKRSQPHAASWRLSTVRHLWNLAVISIIYS